MSPDFLPIVPAAASFSPDGTLYSAQFDDIYASSHGTLAQTQHVFLNGNDLPERWHKSDRFTIVETGFGAGLNFLATWRALREATANGPRLHFVSVEKHPFPVAELEVIHQRYPELRDISADLRERYPPLLPGFHRLHFDNGRVTLTLLFGDAALMLRQLHARADAFFLDGFAPAKNPQMWSDQVFAELARLSGPNATLATYTVASAVCHGLAAVGFAVQKRAGFAHKREMLCGRFMRPVADFVTASERRAIVIGAGLAGSSCAQRLTERGWNVELIERHRVPAQEASGNPAGLVRPVFSLDWNMHSRFTSAAFLYASRHQSALEKLGNGPTHGEGGVLQLARDANHFDKQQRIVEQFALPVDLVRVMHPSAGSRARRCAGSRAGPLVSSRGLGTAGQHVPVESRCFRTSQSAICTGTMPPSLRRVDGRWEVVDAFGKGAGQCTGRRARPMLSPQAGFRRQPGYRCGRCAVRSA